MEILVQHLPELDQAAQHLLAFAAQRRKMAFYGDIGAGKTTFIQAICKQLGVQKAVVSPTFALVNEYNYIDASSKEQIIYHLDLYRLKNIQEALDMGIEDRLYDENYCFIEWPELAETLLPEDTFKVFLNVQPNGKRVLTFA